VRLGFRAERVEVQPDGGLHVCGQGERISGSAVVLAAPQDRAAGMLPSGALRDAAALKRLGFSPIVNLHVVLDRPVLKHEFAAAVSSPVQFVFDRTACSGLERGQCLAVSLSAADAEIDTAAPELESTLRAALAQLIPASREATVERFVGTRDRFA